MYSMIDLETLKYDNDLIQVVVRIISAEKCLRALI